MAQVVGQGPQRVAAGRKPRATIDFETRSRADLKKVGQQRYAMDPSTDVLCLSYKVPGMKRPKTWFPSWVAAILGVPAPADPVELFKWIEEGGMVEAHNAMFERAIWRNIMCLQYFWPDIPNKQWMCSAAKAASYSLPRALDKCIDVMNLPVKKDKDGHKLMMKMCKPRRATKNNSAVWHEEPEDFKRLFLYCEQDVLAEEHFSESLPDLIPVEQALWQIDQEINEYGLPVDPKFVERAIENLDRLKEKYNARICELTGGAVEKASQRARLKEWCSGQGLDLPDTKASTIDALLEPVEPEKPEWASEDYISNQPPELLVPDHIAEVLRMVRQAGRASTAKYQAIQSRMTTKVSMGVLWHCVRDILVYAGASRTSRWAGTGFQPQNLPRGSIKDMEATINQIMDADLEELEEEYDDLFKLFSEALRGAIVAAPGHELHCADYNAIECRGLFWVCNHEKGMDIFRRKLDPYLAMASDIFGIPLETMSKATHPDERQVGKVGILGCGYGLGKNKMVEYAAAQGVEADLEFADKIVTGYRTAHAPVVQFWKDCERAAIEAMHNPGQTVWVNDKIAYKRVNRFLMCRLPSGRTIPYPYPQLHTETTTFVNDDGTTRDWTREVLTYMEINSVTKKWERTKTYGGKLVENIVQALCRDVMGAAMIKVRNHGKINNSYILLLTVHDELVTQAPTGRGNYKELEDLMCELPAWAKGFPITAEGWTGQRYRK